VCWAGLERTRRPLARSRMGFNAALGRKDVCQEVIRTLHTPGSSLYLSVLLEIRFVLRLRCWVIVQSENAVEGKIKISIPDKWDGRCHSALGFKIAYFVLTLLTLCLLRLNRSLVLMK